MAEALLGPKPHEFYVFMKTVYFPDRIARGPGKLQGRRPLLGTVLTKLHPLASEFVAGFQPRKLWEKNDASHVTRGPGFRSAHHRDPPR